MARSGTQANQDANDQYANYESSAMNNYNTQMQGYDQNLAAMTANNPWQSQAYKQNEGKLASAASSAENAQAKQNLLATAARTGTNTAALGDTVASNARAGQRTLDQYNADRQAADTDKSAAWSQQMLQNQLAGANSEAGMYGENVTGRSGALNNLSAEQMADQQMWGQIIAGAAQGAGAGTGAAFGG